MNDGPSDRLRVLELSGGWGLGGTDQAIEIRAGLLPAAFFDVTAVGVWGGPRYDRLLSHGVRGIDLDGNLAKLGTVLGETKPHVLHYTRADRVCGFSAEVQRLAREARVPVVVETNVFGRPAGFAELRPPDRTCHMSFASMLRCATQAGDTMRTLFERGHRAVYLPVPTAAGYAPGVTASRDDARRALGIADGDLVACRVARPDMRKWSVRLELALPRLFAALPELRFLFMAAPPQKLAALERRFGKKVLGLSPESDLGAVARAYVASDLMIHSSGIGESFGLSMAEGMHHGLPVVVDSTPEMDNAQVEVVDHERTGLVVASSTGFVEAATRLARDAELRRRLGEAARATAEARFADTVIAREWQRLYVEACVGAGVIVPAGLRAELERSPARAGVDAYAAFTAEYAGRVARVLGPPSALGERAASALIRSQDMLQHARTLGFRTVWNVVSSRLRSSGSLVRN